MKEKIVYGGLVFEVEIPWDKRVVTSGSVIDGDLVFSVFEKDFVKVQDIWIGTEVKAFACVIRDINIPDDFLNPNFKKTEKIHDWKNHVDDEVGEIWESFTISQKVVLSKVARKKAMQEDWD